MRTFGRPSPPASSCKPHATCGCCAWQTALSGTFVDFVECIRNELFGRLKRSAISAEFQCRCGQANRSSGTYGSLPHGEGQPGGRAAPVVQPRYEAGVGALPRVRPHHAQLHPYAPSPFLCDSTWTTFLSWLFLSTMSCLILCHIPRHFPVHLDGTFSLPLLSFSPGQDSHPKLVVRAQGRVCTCAASGWWTSRPTTSISPTSRRCARS